MLRDSFIAAIRTGVAALVGLTLGWLTAQGTDLPEEFAVNLTTTLMILFTSLYNYLVTLLERNVNPMFGVLLGIPKAPVYGQIGTYTPRHGSPAAVDEAAEQTNNNYGRETN